MIRPQGQRVAGRMSMINSNDTIQNRTRDLLCRCGHLCPVHVVGVFISVVLVRD